jgi:hypothetical protein
MTYSENKTVGALYLLPAFAVVGIWYALLFVGNPIARTPIDAVSYFLSDQTNEAVWFRWMLVGFPLLCLSLSIAYFSRIPRVRVGALVLFCAGILLALAAWGTVNPGLAGLVSAPLLFACKEVRRHLTPHSTGTPSGDR